MFWIRVPSLQAPRVGDRQDHDQDHGDELLGGEADGVVAQDRSGRTSGWASAAIARPEDAEELGEGDRDGRDRPGLDDQEERPAEQEAEHRTVGHAEEDVLARRRGASSRPARPRRGRRRRSSSPPGPRPASSQPGAPTSRADSAEVMKMPEPIIAPMTIIVASSTPRSRCKAPAFADLGVGSVSAVVMDRRSLRVGIADGSERLASDGSSRRRRRGSAFLLRRRPRRRRSPGRASARRQSVRAVSRARVSLLARWEAAP